MEGDQTQVMDSFLFQRLVCLYYSTDTVVGWGGTRSLFTKWGMGSTLRILFPVYSPLLLFFSPLIIMSNFSLHIKLIIFFSSFHGLLASLSISFFYFVCLVLCFLFFFQGIERNVVDGCRSWIVFLNHCGGFRSRRDG